MLYAVVLKSTFAVFIVILRGKNIQVYYNGFNEINNKSYKRKLNTFNGMNCMLHAVKLQIRLHNFLQMLRFIKLNTN